MRHDPTQAMHTTDLPSARVAPTTFVRFYVSTKVHYLLSVAPCPLVYCITCSKRVVARSKANAQAQMEDASVRKTHRMKVGVFLRRPCATSSSHTALAKSAHVHAASTLDIVCKASLGGWTPRHHACKYDVLLACRQAHIHSYKRTYIANHYILAMYVQQQTHAMKEHLKICAASTTCFTCKQWTCKAHPGGDLPHLLRFDFQARPTAEQRALLPPLLKKWAGI